jgi:hypothetical protein
MSFALSLLHSLLALFTLERTIEIWNIIIPFEYKLDRRPILTLLKSTPPISGKVGVTCDQRGDFTSPHYGMFLWAFFSTSIALAQF